MSEAPWNVLVALPVLVCAGTVGWAAVRTWTVRRAGGAWGAGGVRERLAPATAGCALLSAASTFLVPVEQGHGPVPDDDAVQRSYWSLAEAGLLLLLVMAVVRFAPPAGVRLAVPFVALAVSVWPLVLIDGSFLEGVGVVAFWLLPVVVAVGAGAYPRRAADRRRQAVDEARREQRLRLSRDLHDFVAHDISGIVVQAQAARFVAEADPGQALAALERIERAGLNALASMDRTVAMLHTTGAPGGAPPGPDRLPALVADFGAAGGAVAVLDADDEALGALTREAGAAAYRIVVEALTNVRRHAAGATHVVVRIRRTGAGIEVSVADDGGRGAAGTARFRLPRRAHGAGGLGLPALTEHITALGGTLTAGPVAGAGARGAVAAAGGGWRVTAVFPGPEPDEPDRAAQPPGPPAYPTPRSPYPNPGPKGAL
ncbi:sensor histidine kinase [Streptomyces tsukubensis]|uniref:sensor histidine kinase n=1 Tax=Streptomyces tsukubensis TaxID=83656 RepID=UPI0036829AB1